MGCRFDTQSTSIFIFLKESLEGLKSKIWFLGQQNPYRPIFIYMRLHALSIHSPLFTQSLFLYLVLTEGPSTHTHTFVLHSLSLFKHAPLFLHDLFFHTLCWQRGHVHIHFRSFHIHSLFSNILTLFLHNLFFHTLCYIEEPATRPLLYIHTPLLFFPYTFFSNILLFFYKIFFFIPCAKWRGWPPVPSTTTYTCFLSTHTLCKVYKLLLCWRFICGSVAQK